MRRIATTAGVSVLLLLTAACAQDGTGQEAKVQPGKQPELSTSTPKPAEPGGSGSDLTAPKGASEVDAQQVDAAALPENYPKQVWTQKNGKVVAAYGEEGGCDTIKLKVAEQTDREVRLNFVEKPAGPSKMCTMQVKRLPLSVALDAPLGDRKVVLEQQTLPLPKGPR